MFRESSFIKHKLEYIHVIIYFQLELEAEHCKLFDQRNERAVSTR